MWLATTILDSAALEKAAAPELMLKKGVKWGTATMRNAMLPWGNSVLLSISLRKIF